VLKDSIIAVIVDGGGVGKYGHESFCKDGWHIFEALQKCQTKVRDAGHHFVKWRGRKGRGWYAVLELE
jgi:hypothetical protein